MNYHYSIYCLNISFFPKPFQKFLLCYILKFELKSISFISKREMLCTEKKKSLSNIYMYVVEPYAQRPRPLGRTRYIYNIASIVQVLSRKA